MSFTPILQPGRNCWRILRADRVAFLIDGDAYFRVLYDALTRAQHDIMVLSWDIYSDIRLGALQGDQRPLATLLDDLLNKNDRLHVRILNWDFAVLFAMSREWLPMYKLGWKTHPHLEFQMDAQHPVGASHHQKVVVIDNQLAFSGGLDITRGRWDTPEHKASDARRKQVDGTLGRPYHDVQIAVSGEAAQALNELARERWQRATGRKLTEPEPAQNHSIWPTELTPDLEQVDIAISRTMPGFRDHKEAREVEQLYLDVIEQAQDYIYIENQYFTSPRIGEALAQRLRNKQGPEIIINLPLETEGWLAQNSMDVIRVRLLKQLREADQYHRLAVYYPYKSDLETMPINLHAKIMISDDRFVRVGSSNINNRSMALDTECDIAIECRPDDEKIKAGLVAFRNRLLTEHLGVDEQQLDKACEQEHSLIKAIESLRNSGERSLRPLEQKLPAYSDSVLTDEDLIDPAQPFNVDDLLYHVLPEQDTTGPARRIAAWVISLIALLALAAAWRYTPLAQWLDVDQIAGVITQLRSSPLAPVVLVAAFVIAGLLMVPLTLMIIASVIVFGVVTGSLYALVSAVGCALAGYGLGTLLGKDAIKNLAGGRINRISQQLARRGVFTIIAVRIVPVAPFTVINMVAGASHISLRDFFIGNVLGLIPGIAAVALLTDRVRATLENPQPGTIALLLIVIVLVVSGGFLLSRYMMKQRKS